MKLAYNISRDVGEWVIGRVPPIFGSTPDAFGNYKAIGVLNENNVLVAGVVFNDYSPQFDRIMVHLAATTPRWATRNIIREILAYPFEQLKINKVWGATPHHMARVLRFNHGIGFTQEAVLGAHFGEHHAVITRMFAKDYKRFYIDEGSIKALALHRAKMRPQLQLREAA